MRKRVQMLLLKDGATCAPDYRPIQCSLKLVIPVPEIMFAGLKQYPAHRPSNSRNKIPGPAFVKICLLDMPYGIWSNFATISLPSRRPPAHAICDHHHSFILSRHHPGSGIEQEEWVTHAALLGIQPFVRSFILDKVGGTIYRLGGYLVCADSLTYFPRNQLI